MRNLLLSPEKNHDQNNLESKNTVHSTQRKIRTENNVGTDSDKIRSPIHKKTSRILILQGGGALGAYEAGVLKFLSKALRNEDYKKNEQNKSLFDIVVGTSMGAVNAAILVHNVINPEHKELDEYKKWDKSIKKLTDFYFEISDPDFFHPLWWVNKFCFEDKRFEQFWGFLCMLKKFLLTANYACQQLYVKDQKITGLVEEIRKNYEKNSPSWVVLRYSDLFRKNSHELLPTSENARRYYYYLSSVMFGIPKVLSPAIIQPDLLYFDPLWFTHVYTRFSNEPLIKTIKHFWNYEKFPIRTYKDQPRLMLVTVDIEDSTIPVIIDSHPKDRRKDSLYSEYGNSRQYRIEYQNGITEEHVRASMSTPLRHEYPSFKVYNKDTRKEEIRYFWDGAFITNSPVREAIRAHIDYWKQKKDAELPDLEIYMVNLYPTVKKGIPDEPYSIQDRETDMRFQNRVSADDILDIINSDDRGKPLYNTSKFPAVRNENVARISKFVKIERTENVGNSVFGKAFDFSRKTISKLIDDGYRDAMKSIQ